MLWQWLVSRLRARFDRRGVAEDIRMVRISVRGLAKTDGDDIARYEWYANHEARGSRTPGARLGTPPLKFRNGDKLPQH